MKQNRDSQTGHCTEERRKNEIARAEEHGKQHEADEDEIFFAHIFNLPYSIALAYVQF
jgi:hypothetical protein